jgi:hypothetical protein
MPKLFPLSVALCLSLTGCQVFEKSKTWDTVVSVRPGDSFRQADPSAYYAEKLHQVLLKEGVEHCVVTYQYHYYTHHYEEAVGKRTAIVYRAETDGRHPWWLKDDQTATPFWLPDSDLDAQISFYCRRKAEVLEKKHYPAHSSGKEVAAPRRTTQNKVQFRTTIALWAAPVTSAPMQQAAGPGPRDGDLEKLFRVRNGTSYDPTSATDRRKMEQLRRGLLDKETTGRRGFRQGVDGGVHSEF